MYRSYEIELSRGAFSNQYERLKPGISALYPNLRKSLACKIAQYGYDKNIPVDGELIEKTWFPQGEFHVFISHSHKDIELASCLAVYLKWRMGINAFVDSLVWGYRDTLIKQLTPTGLGHYRWTEEQKLSFTSSVASHVDCMLLKSLMEVMDRCECILFLNTPNAMTTEGVCGKTMSAWIYGEMEAARRLRKIVPERLRLTKRAMENYSRVVLDESVGAQPVIMMSHPMDTSHLQKISSNKFVDWTNAVVSTDPQQSLDTLYSLMK